MSLREIFNREPDYVIDGSQTPPVFADLVLDMSPDPMLRVDVERPGWLEPIQPLMAKAARVGLTMRDENKVRVWVTTNGDPVRYFTRVVGQIGQDGHRRWRVAGLLHDGQYVWLHRDGLVEIGPEPQREN